ncbi:MAG TPA: FAD binding domain-containing protein [Ferrovibrio sp.]|uniref:FAD binding domain-containing protein n=1 Tax=Ferrovibrio sp. TaxID=1917215 RepID=UPI002ED609F5
MASYLRPTSLDEALASLSAAGAHHPVILAGGTDFYPARVGRALDDDVLDITAIPDLRGISETEEGWRLGATTTWSELVAAELPPLFDGLKQAGREIGGRQIQNAGTIAGNLCNASPAADSVPPLLAMRAKVEIRGRGQCREAALSDFITGNRRTSLKPGELVSAILVPRPKHDASSIFLKLGARSYLVISIAMVGVVLESEGDVVAAANVAVGACSEVAQRLPYLEAELIGRRLNAALANRVKPEHFEPLSPIDDVRANAAYRREAAVVLVRRALAALAKQNGG